MTSEVPSSQNSLPVVPRYTKMNLSFVKFIICCRDAACVQMITCTVIWDGGGATQCELLLISHPLILVSLSSLSCFCVSESMCVASLTHACQWHLGSMKEKNKSSNAALLIQRELFMYQENL